ncbi:MAG: anaerobic ribonucleoside-triphosphate reductase activating protein [Sphaerochaeta sp.]|jgi:pyruvate formate lyase activating enzyme|nr:anaerobic ribonucleoside-triphosphate reductase activating protein [Sphaerochaeta sp.]MCH3919761.1 anaerobic ribonucleoside-triphosphate reductase activating protein [Sphaerochaeta sp.]MCI2045512.1 anaerobic ribonucleoside-triphosphate reductase activating protein [Sphaerochaeta sp.]MCI2076742.1 anaerobic ribonucleoside-triphosphate reductase activating protein [Sphaerochaeta sp.]MCI2096676.1 anaerobic ribonucleoside-triphosphate reductase activating protein [Sphaerochaeta sp.]
MRIGGFQPVDLVNFPSVVAATVFTMGCDCRCPYCHNPTLVRAEEPPLSEEDVVGWLRERKDLVDGVVVSGGEPCMQDDLPGFLRTIKEMGFRVKLDTNGSYPWMLSALFSDGLLDYVAMDIKADREGYLRVAGIPASRVEASVSLLLGGSVPYEFRTTCVKELLTTEDIRSIGTWIHGAKRYVLQRFNPKVTLDKKAGAWSSFSDEELEELAKALSPDVSVVIR